MKKLILIICLLLVGCQTMTDGEGNVIMKSVGFARNGKAGLFLKGKFAEPLTTNTIALAGKEIKPYLVPGMTEIEVNKTFASESNIGSAFSGGAEFLGAASSLSPL